MPVKDYYTIDSMTETEGGAVFCVSLNPSCEVYEGHFPSHHISPGVCNIRMVIECAEWFISGRFPVKESEPSRAGAGNAEPAAGVKLRITEIHRCRFTSLITPDDTPRLTIRIFVTGTDFGTFKLKSEILSYETSCLSLDCTLTNK